MLDQLLQASDALREAQRGGHLAGVLMPAMYGCPDCKTAWVIASPARIGACAECGVVMTVLGADQAAAAMAGARPQLPF